MKPLSFRYLRLMIGMIKAIVLTPVSLVEARIEKVSLACMFAVAYSARARAILPKCVLGRVRMAVQTCVAAYRYCARAIASEDIGSDGNSFKMLRIHTGRITAEVVNGESFRDWALHKFIGKAVRKHFFSGPPAKVEGAIARRQALCLPYKAISNSFGVSPETFFNWHRLWPCFHSSSVAQRKSNSKTRLATQEGGLSWV